MPKSKICTRSIDVAEDLHAALSHREPFWSSVNRCANWLSIRVQDELANPRPRAVCTCVSFGSASHLWLLKCLHLHVPLVMSSARFRLDASLITPPPALRVRIFSCSDRFRKTSCSCQLVK